MLLDTSIIIEVFRSPSNSRRFNQILEEIGDEEVYASIVQMAEVADWAVRNRVPAKDRIEAVKEFTHIVPLSERICLDAATIKRERRRRGHRDFGLLDGVVLASARFIGQRLLTLDGDFEGEHDCIVMA